MDYVLGINDGLGELIYGSWTEEKQRVFSVERIIFVTPEKGILSLLDLGHIRFFNVHA